MGRKLTYKEVNDSFEKRGYKLLESEYKVKDIPMRYECPHHRDKEIRICYNSLRNGNGCRFCSSEKISKKLRLDYEKVEEEFSNAGYRLLGNIYENAHTKLHYQCPLHPHLNLSMSLSNLKAGKRCKNCRNDEATARNKTPMAEIKKLFEERGYELLDTSYIGSGKLKYRCPKHLTNLIV